MWAFFFNRPGGGGRGRNKVVKQGRQAIPMFHFPPDVWLLKTSNGPRNCLISSSHKDARIGWEMQIRQDGFINYETNIPILSLSLSLPSFSYPKRCYDKWHFCDGRSACRLHFNLSICLSQAPPLISFSLSLSLFLSLIKRGTRKGGKWMSSQCIQVKIKWAYPDCFEFILLENLLFQPISNQDRKTMNYLSIEF